MTAQRAYYEITVRLPRNASSARTLRRLKALAKADHRSVNAFITRLIEGATEAPR